MSAGSHSTEEVGRLLDQLEAEHQVYRYANRDPMGMNGFTYMLSPDRGE